MLGQYSRIPFTLKRLVGVPRGRRIDYKGTKGNMGKEWLGLGVYIEHIIPTCSSYEPIKEWLNTRKELKRDWLKNH